MRGVIKRLGVFRNESLGFVDDLDEVDNVSDDRGGHFKAEKYEFPYCFWRRAVVAFCPYD